MAEERREGEKKKRDQLPREEGKKGRASSFKFGPAPENENPVLTVQHPESQNSESEKSVRNPLKCPDTTHREG